MGLFTVLAFFVFLVFFRILGYFFRVIGFFLVFITDFKGFFKNLFRVLLGILNDFRFVLFCFVLFFFQFLREFF